MKKAIIGKHILTDDRLGPGCILLENGKILAVSAALPAEFQGQVEDMGELVVMPGLVDTHVHINEPGRTDWEGFETASQSAAAGGITTLVDMPLNCIPVTTSAPAFDEKRQAVADQLWVDCGFWGGVVPESIDQLPQLLAAGVLGVKSFLIDSGIAEFPPMASVDLHKAMAILKNHRVPYLIHAELEDGNPAVSEIDHRYTSFLDSRPKSWENSAIQLMIELAKTYQTPVHIVHLSSAEALPALARAKEAGIPITVETCPHYLCFAAETIPNGKTLFKCCPPIREEANREALWRGLETGVIDFIVSDHSPCTPALKRMEEGDFAKAWGGISSLQFGLSLIWTEARKRGFDEKQLSQWLCRKPAEMMGFGHRKGRIAAGMDADLVIWDPQAQYQIDPKMIYHKHQTTPYSGRNVFGKVIHTLLAGERVFGPDGFATQARGKLLLKGD